MTQHCDTTATTTAAAALAWSEEDCDDDVYDQDFVDEQPSRRWQWGLVGAAGAANRTLCAPDFVSTASVRSQYAGASAQGSTVNKCQHV